jgi:hypothetical protein
MKSNRLLFGLIFFFCLVVSLKRADAEWNYTFIPTASLNLEYDSNIYNTTRDKKSDFDYQGSVFLPFHATSTDSDLSLSYRTSRFQYFSEGTANYGNHFFNFQASHTFSPRFRLSMVDAYSITKDSDRVLRSGSIEGETGIIAERSKRKSNRVTGSLSYSLTHRSSLILSGTNAFYRYTRPEQYDSKSNGGTISYNYVLSPTDTLFATASQFNSDYSRSSRQLSENAVFGFNGLFYDLLFFDEFDQSKNTSAYAGLTHRFSSTLTATLYAGARRTKNTILQLHLQQSPGDSVTITNALPNSIVSYTLNGSTTPQFAFVDSTGILTIPDAVIATTGDSTTSSGLVYKLSLTKSFRNSSLTLGFDQDVVTRTTAGGTTERQGYNAVYIYHFSDLLSADLRGRYDKNTQDTGTRNDKYHTLRLGIGANYDITRNLSSRLSWNYTKQKRDITGAINTGSTKRNLVLLSFVYQWPLVR